MGTVIPYEHRGNDDRHARWERTRRAELLARSGDRQAPGLSHRQAAQLLPGPRSTLPAWQAYHASLDAPPALVAFFHSPVGLAFWPRLVLAVHLVCVEVGACGIRLVCLLLKRTGLDRFVAAAYGVQPQVNRHGEEASVTYRHEEQARLAQDMPTQASTWAQDATCPGGLCLIAIEPKSHFLVLAQAAPGRDHDPWHALMEQALAGLNGQVIQATSDEAPGLLAYVDHYLGAHHSPDFFHVQHELVKAVAGPMATQPRAAAKAASEAQERLEHRPEQRQGAGNAPHQRGPSRPPRAAASLEPLVQAAPVARQECERLSAPREQGAQSIRMIGPVYHVVDVERGVRRNGQLIAADSRAQLGIIRSVAQHEGRTQPCWDRIDKAERVVPKMPAPSELVSGAVRQPGRPLALPPPVSYALHAHRMPACYLERVAQRRTVRAGEPLRALAARLRPPLFEPGGALAELSEGQQSQLHQQAKELAEVLQRSSSNVEGRNGDLSLRNHPLRGLDRPRKRACLTAIHHGFLTRPDGTTAAERFFGQKPRSMCAAILESVAIPPAPLRPLRHAVG